MSRGWAKASACCLQTTLSCAFLCHIVSLQYLSRSSLHRLAGLPCRLFLSYGLQLVTREVHRSSLRRLICPAQDHCECRLEGDKNTRDFPLFKQKRWRVGDISYVVPTKLKMALGNVNMFAYGETNASLCPPILFANYRHTLAYRVLEFDLDSQNHYIKIEDLQMIVSMFHFN